MIHDLIDTFNALTTMQFVVVLMAVILWLLRLLYLLFFPFRLLVYRNSKPAQNKQTPLSILMVVRNEEENCRKTIPNLVNLENPDLELVVVDDFSQDNTFSVLGLLKQRYKKIKLSSLSQETRYSEKMARNIALKSAGNNWVIAYPINAYYPGLDWLNEMGRLTPESVSVKVAYSSVVESKGWYNKLFRVENFFQYIKSASYSLNGMPFLYNEENVAFKKSEYFIRGGFGAKVQEPYANLELVINRFIRKKNLELMLNRSSTIKRQVLVDEPDFKDLIKKSIRIEQHLSKWKQFVLFVDRWHQALYLPVMVLTLVVALKIWPVIATMVFVNVLVFMVIIKMLQNRLNEANLFITSLVFSIIIPFYKLIFRWFFNQKIKKHKWRNKV